MVQGDSQKLPWSQPISVIFLDSGDWTKRWAKGQLLRDDLDKFGGLVIKGGSILVHDYNVGAVRKIIRSWLNHNPDFVLTDRVKVTARLRKKT